MSFTLAIIGRPNVGKSTLFNRFIGKKLAIVDDTPGVTRDWRVAEAHLMGLEFDVIDTAGLEERFDDSMEGRMRTQTEAALDHADMAMMMIDVRAGVTPMDKHFASWLRKQEIPCIVVVNKCEIKGAEEGFYEAYELGLGEPIAISAEHALGMEEIYDVLRPLVEAANEMLPDAMKEDQGVNYFADIEEGSDTGFGDKNETDEDLNRTIKVAIVGRPNVGKSTLLNALIGENRVLTGPEPGVTRDAITVDWEHKGRSFKLVDTAGMRRRSKVVNKLERLSVIDSLRAIRLAQIVVLVLDANAVFDKQDLIIASKVIAEGRALVVALNKWDSVENREEALKKLQDKLDLSLGQVKNVPTVTISALNKHRLDKLIKKMFTVYETWNKRIPTRPLNMWLGDMGSRHPAPLVQGRPNKLRYTTQIKARPPTFAIWVSKPEAITDNYKRYLINGLREDFDIPGVPIRLLIRTTKNPYV